MTSTNTPSSIINLIKDINTKKGKDRYYQINPSTYAAVYEYYDPTNSVVENSVITTFRIINNSTLEDELTALQRKIKGRKYKKIRKYLEIPSSDTNTILRKQQGVIKILLNNINKTNNVLCSSRELWDNNNRPIFIELFSHKDGQTPTEKERRISTLFDGDSKKIIGYRYYENYNIFGNSLIAINDKEEISAVNCGLSTRNPLINISDNINRKLYIDEYGASIGGKKGFSFDYLSTLNEKCKADTNNKCCVLSINPRFYDNPADTLDNTRLNDVKNYRKLNRLFKLDNKKITGNNFALLPIRCNNHASVIIIDLKRPNVFYSFDSSTAHRERYPNQTKLNKKIFGRYLKNHTNSLIDDINLQFNGTCTYWSDAFCEVVVTSPEYNGSNGEDGLTNIDRDCKNGTMFLKCAKSIGRIFDKDINLPTVMIYEGNQRLSNKYYNFTIDGKNYGISKTSGLNKFVNLETLVKILGREKEDETEASLSEQEEIERIKDSLKNQIEGQKKIREKEREIVNFEQLEKAKEKYEEYTRNKINNINSKINNLSKIHFIKRLNLQHKITNLEAERDSFREKFDECKKLYDNTNRKHIGLEGYEPTEEEKENIKNSKYNWLRLYVKDNVDLTTVAENDILYDYINSFELGKKISNLAAQIQTFKIMKDNKYKFDFCSEVDEVVDIEETRTINEIEQPIEIRENQEAAEAELNITTTEGLLETRPTIPNAEITSSFSNITATNAKNTTNSRPPTNPNNPNNNVAEKTMF